MESSTVNNPEPSKQDGLEEITVIVNGQGVHRRKYFRGQLLVRRLQSSHNDEGTDVINVYRTAGKRYAVHTRYVPEWDVTEGDPDYWGNPDNWGVRNGFLRKLMGIGWDWETFKESGDYSLEVFDTLQELSSHVSNDLYQAVSQAMKEPESEYLDI